jgi:hypothetical protein
MAVTLRAGGVGGTWQSVQFILASFYQNVRRVVHERYETDKVANVALFIQPLARLQQIIVDPKQLLDRVVVDNHREAVYVTFSERPSQL